MSKKAAQILMEYGVYSYAIPGSLSKKLKVGIRVKVEVRKRLMWGVVVGKEEAKENKLKPIQEIIDEVPLFSASYLSFAREVAQYYASNWFEILKLSTGGKEGKNFPLHEKSAVKRPPKSVAPRGEFIPYLCLFPSYEERWKKYVTLLEKNIAEGKKTLLIFPEWESYSLLREKVASCFPEEAVFFSSALTPRQRRENLKKIICGEAKIIAGTRSAFWLPITNLGMIIMEDIHSSSYKSPSHPRYFLPEVALIRGKTEKIPVILSSPVPPIEYLYLMEKGQIREFSINRSFHAPLVTLVNMRREERRMKSKGLSKHLIEKIEERLGKGESVAVLVNRRGFAGYRVCKVCRYIQKCKDCSIPLSYHKPDIMLCHQCGSVEEVEEICPRCQASYTKVRATGTQKIEEALKKIFPSVPIIRCDRDTEKKEREIDPKKLPFILVGTKMLRRIFLPDQITLLGLINADTHLFRPDFRSSEKTFQFLGEWISLMEGKDKEVIIQTYHAEDPSIKFSLNLDWREFYREELVKRKELFYPPFSHIFYLIITAADSHEAQKAANQLKETIQTNFAENVHCLGPLPVQKKGKNFSTQIMLKSPSRQTLLSSLTALKKQIASLSRKKIRVIFDLFPLQT
ncbi:MAG: primosomal protein N' [Caldiserica bacterium]|nr:primosomal protein N' [Caldisericota bacterium]